MKTELDPVVLHGLAEKHVVDENDRSIPVGSFWQNDRAALVFVRHFG